MQFALIGQAISAFFSSKAFKWFAVISGVGLAIYLFYRWSKKQGGYVSYPDNGKGIPAGWSPVPFAERLYNAIAGLGTDEPEIWAVLEGAGLTNDMKAAVYNQYMKSYGTRLEIDLRDDLNAEDYTRALAALAPILK